MISWIGACWDGALLHEGPIRLVGPNARHDAHPSDRSSTSRGLVRVRRGATQCSANAGERSGRVELMHADDRFCSAPIRLVVMEGDGIGPEITAATLEVLRAVDRAFALGLAFEPVTIGLAALRAHGTTLPEAAVDAATAADGVILGPVSHNDYPPVAQGGLNPSGELRKRLDLYANIRPARSRGGFPPRCGAAGRSRDRPREHRRGSTPIAPCSSAPGEFMPTPDLALSVRKITRGGSTRIARSRLRTRHAPAQEGDGGAQGQCAAGVGRTVPRVHARGRRRLSAG